MSDQNRDATIPGYFPTQDGIDRSDHLAIVTSISIDPAEMASDTFDWQVFPTLRPDYNRWVREAIKEASHGIEVSSYIVDVETGHYQIGPAAGGMIDNIQEITTLVGPISDAVRDVVIAQSLRGIFTRIKEKARNWANNQPVETMKIHTAYTPLVLKHLSVGYLADFYGVSPSTEVIIECVTKDFYDGYSSPAHPTALLEYLVVVPHNEDTYTLRIMGDSQIVSLKRTRNGFEQHLPTFRYLDDLRDENEATS